MKNVLKALKAAAAVIAISTMSTVASAQAVECNVGQNEWGTSPKSMAEERYAPTSAHDFAMRFANQATNGQETALSIPTQCRGSFVQAIAERNGWRIEETPQGMVITTNWESVGDQIFFPIRMSVVQPAPQQPTPAPAPTSDPEVSAAADRAQAAAAAAEVAERRVETLERNDAALAAVPQTRPVQAERSALATAIAEARQAAAEAQASATAAEQAAQRAVEARNQAETFATNAGNSAEAAAGSATAADGSATEAAGSATAAAESAAAAAQSAEDAKASSLPQWLSDWLAGILALIGLALAILFGLMFNTRKRVNTTEKTQSDMGEELDSKLEGDTFGEYVTENEQRVGDMATQLGFQNVVFDNESLVNVLQLKPDHCTVLKFSVGDQDHAIKGVYTTDPGKAWAVKGKDMTFTDPQQFVHELIRDKKLHYYKVKDSSEAK